jgi:Zinc finger, C3HC4 type (RING finger)
VCPCTHLQQQKWGEYRDRRKRWQYAEQRSKLTCVERQKAQQLQMEFRTRCCPICLENYDYGDSQIQADPENLKDNHESDVFVTGSYENSTNSLVSLLSDLRKGVVDEMGIPRRGADGRKIKLLRCGHIFCETCWRNWVHSTACGSPCSCPVCRQDVGKSLCRSRRSQSVPGRISSSSSSSTSAASTVVDSLGGEPNSTTGQTANSTLRSILSRNGQSYDSFADTNAPSSSVNRPATNGRIVRVNTMLRGAILFRQTSTMANRSTDYVEQSNHNTETSEATPLLTT